MPPATGRVDRLKRRAAVAQLERGEDVALEVEVAGDVRAPEAELAGRGDDASQRVGRPDHDRGGRVGGAAAAAVVGPELDREVGTQNLFDE